LQGKIVGTDVDPLAPALQRVDRAVVMPRVRSEDYIPALCEVIEEEHIDAVFPLTDPDVRVLSRHRGELQRCGAAVAVVSRQSAELAADKWQTKALLERLRLPSARSWLPAQMNVGEVDFPLFIKPRHVSTAQQVFAVRDEEELAFFSRYINDPIVQEYLPGPEITSDVICDFDGTVLAVVSRERIRVRHGEVLIGRTIFDELIDTGCRRIAEALPAVGPFTVQCMRDEDEMVRFTEINPRMGGGMPLAIAAGADAPRWLLSRLAGNEVKPLGPGEYQQGLYVSRFDDAMFITEEQRQVLAGQTAPI
jgi:carbamoyl-phosphate synthase large subunit